MTYAFSSAASEFFNQYFAGLLHQAASLTLPAAAALLSLATTADGPLQGPTEAPRCNTLEFMANRNGQFTAGPTSEVVNPAIAAAAAAVGPAPDLQAFLEGRKKPKGIPLKLVDENPRQQAQRAYGIVCSEYDAWDRVLGEYATKLLQEAERQKLSPQDTEALVRKYVAPTWWAGEAHYAEVLGEASADVLITEMQWADKVAEHALLIAKASKTVARPRDPSQYFGQDFWKAALSEYRERLKVFAKDNPGCDAAVLDEVLCAPLGQGARSYWFNRGMDADTKQLSAVARSPQTFWGGMGEWSSDVWNVSPSQAARPSDSIFTQATRELLYRKLDLALPKGTLVALDVVGRTVAGGTVIIVTVPLAGTGPGGWVVLVAFDGWALDQISTAGRELYYGDFQDSVGGGLIRSATGNGKTGAVLAFAYDVVPGVVVGSPAGMRGLVRLAPISVSAKGDLLMAQQMRPAQLAAASEAEIAAAWRTTPAAYAGAEIGAGKGMTRYLVAGRAWESAQLTDLSLSKNNVLWRPTDAQTQPDTADITSR